MKKIISGLTLASVLLLYALTDLHAAAVVNVNFDNGGVIDSAIKTQVETEIHNRVDKYSDMPDFTRGFGNANTYASHAATLRGYQGYDIFAVSVGSMVAVQAPDLDPQYYKDVKDELDDGDLYAGVGMQPVALQAGLNLGFLADGLYASLKFGKLSYDLDLADQKLDYDSMIFGVLVDYQILKKRSLLLGTLVWRGVTLESGFIYSTSEVVYYKDIKSFTVITGGYTAVIDPSVSMGMDVSSYIIPVEIYTAFRLAWAINFGIGAGFDYAMGETDLNIKSEGKATITSPAAATGKLTIDASTKGVESDKFRPKLGANIGLSLGPVFVDVPATVYLDNGFSVGISAGIAW